MSVLTSVEIIHRCHEGGDLEDENGRETVFELCVLGLVMPCFHAEESTDATTENGYPNEACFCDAPFVMARLPFVDTVQEKRDDINRREINQKTI